MPQTKSASCEKYLPIPFFFFLARYNIYFIDQNTTQLPKKKGKFEKIDSAKLPMHYWNALIKSIWNIFFLILIEKMLLNKDVINMGCYHQSGWFIDTECKMIFSKQGESSEIL